MSAVAFFALAAERSLRVCSCRPQLRLSTLLHRSIDPYMNLQLSPWRIDKTSPVETSKFRVRHKAEHGRVGAALVCLHPVEVPSAKAKAACMFQVDGSFRGNLGEVFIRCNNAPSGPLQVLRFRGATVLFSAAACACARAARYCISAAWPTRSLTWTEGHGSFCGAVGWQAPRSFGQQKPQRLCVFGCVQRPYLYGTKAAKSWELP